MADKFFIRVFQPLASVSTDAVLQYARTKNGVATRTLLADLDDAGLFRATSFGVYGGSNGTDFSSGIPGLITVSKGLVTSVTAFAGFTDTNALVIGSADATKKLRFEVDGFTTATTRVLTPLNKDYTIEETSHASKHLSGGSDAIALDTLGAPTDITTLNASTSAHGLLKKLDNTATNFLDGTGAWDSVKDSDLSTSDITTNDVSTSKHGFAPKAPNDATKFLDGTGAYSTPAGAATGMTLIAENLLGSDVSSVTFNSIPGTYRHLKVVFYGRVTGATVAEEIVIRFNNDSTSIYERIKLSAQGSASFLGVTATLAQSSIVVGNLPGTSSSRTTQVGEVEIIIAHYAGTTFDKMCHCTALNVYSTSSTSNNPLIQLTGGAWRSTAAITRLDFLPAAGNFKAGTLFSLYGML